MQDNVNYKRNSSLTRSDDNQDLGFPLTHCPTLSLNFAVLANETIKSRKKASLLSFSEKKVYLKHKSVCKEKTMFNTSNLSSTCCTNLTQRESD